LKDVTEEYFVPEELRQHPVWIRLNAQLSWYDRKSGDNQRRYNQIKVSQLVLAGSIPVFALVDDTWGRWVTAILGASVAILEGLQQLGQYNNLWVSYRATAEQLRHEKVLFLAKSGSYRELEEAEAWKLLAERIEERVSTEHTKWGSDRSKQAGNQEQQGEK
jgi:hypothetical protein